MPSINITIPLPVLTGTQKFRVRYSANNGGSWTTVVPDQTNATFNIPGLSVGTYLLEFSVIDGVILCPPTYRTFEVVPDFACWEFSAALYQTGDLHHFEVSYTSGTPPPCGWIIEYNQVGGAITTVPYATLPASPFVIPVPGTGDYELRIYANLCRGNERPCFEDTFTPIVICTPLVLTSTNIIQFPWFIVMTFTNSNPVTDPMFAIWHQVGSTFVGVPDPGGSGFLKPVFTGGNGSLTIPVNPNTFVSNSTVTYDVKIIDVCGNEHTFSVSMGL